MSNHHVPQFVTGPSGKPLSVGTAYKVTGNPNKGVIGKTAASTPKAKPQKASASESVIPSEDRFAPIPANPQNAARDQGFRKVKQVPVSKREHISTVPLAAAPDIGTQIRILRQHINEKVEDLNRSNAAGNLRRVAVNADLISRAISRMNELLDLAAADYLKAPLPEPQPNPLQKPHLTVAVKPRRFKRWSDK